jgi:hypothetical protein
VSAAPPGAGLARQHVEPLARQHIEPLIAHSVLPPRTAAWNDCSSFRDNGPNGWCWESEAHVKNVTLYMISSGLAKLGYVQVNVDEGALRRRRLNRVAAALLSRCLLPALTGLFAGPSSLQAG